jgi:hypothetical protein
MYKIDYYNSQDEIILTQTFKSIKELFEASYKTSNYGEQGTLFEIGATSAVAHLDNTILLNVSSDDLILEFNIEPFRTNDELYELLLSYGKNINVENWIRTPTKEELKEYLNDRGKDSFLLGACISRFRTKEFEWKLDSEDSHHDIQTLFYSIHNPDFVMYYDSKGEAKNAFHIDDFIIANTGCSCKDFFILLVEYPNAN